MAIGPRDMSLKLRETGLADLDFVLKAEGADENRSFISQQTRSQHQTALSDPDIAHLIIEQDGRAVGYVIMAGLQNPNQSLELRRIVITDKGQGYGRASLGLLKQLAFGPYRAHRLWLDVKAANQRARHVYETEGFVTEGILRDYLKEGDSYQSLVIMSILENEYAHPVERV